jgi:hypothetical protein
MLWRATKSKVFGASATKLPILPMVSITYNLKKVKQSMLVDRKQSFGYSKEIFREGEHAFLNERQNTAGIY